jgi:hypothetical protein
LARFKHGGGSRLWNVVDMVRACSGDILHVATVTGSWGLACLGEIGGSQRLEATTVVWQLSLSRKGRWIQLACIAVLPSGLASSSDSCGVTLDRERNNFVACWCFTHIPQISRAHVCTPRNFRTTTCRSFAMPWGTWQEASWDAWQLKRWGTLGGLPLGHGQAKSCGDQFVWKWRGRHGRAHLGYLGGQLFTFLHHATTRC